MMSVATTLGGTCHKPAPTILAMAALGALVATFGSCLGRVMRFGLSPMPTWPVVLLLSFFTVPHPAHAQDCTEISDWNDIQFFRECLKDSSPADWTAPSGTTLLHNAASTNNPTIVILVLEAGFDPDARNDDGATPLHYGANNPNPVVTSHLLAAGADPNAMSNAGYTPLHSATANDNERVIKVLLDAAADPNALSNDGWTPFHSAVFYSRSVSVFLDAGADVGLTPLQRAIVHDQIPTARSMLAQGADPDAADKYGWTALHFAAPQMDRPTVSRLLVAGADVNARTANGLTALHLAADRSVVAALVAAGAEIDARNDIGRTPLHQAAIFRNALIVEALLDAGADIELRDNEGNRPIDLAERNSRIDEDSDVVRRLKGSDANRPQ